MIRSGLPIVVKKISRAYFARATLVSTGEVIPSSLDYETAKKERSSLIEKDAKAFHEAEKINHASYYRTKRLRERLGSFLTEDGSCLFLTLTFTDTTLSSTSEKERRVLITRFLKRCGGRYVANKDFGRKNGREHYHAVVKADKIDFTEWHKYGAIHCEVVHRPNSNAKLSRYISKLTNHATKKTTKRSVIIYSR